MIDIRNLQKIGDILNSEGSILGLYKRAEAFFLGSFLADGTGTVYYSTTREKLQQYFHSQVTLQQLYQESDDYFVTKRIRREDSLFLKADFLNRLQCGD